MIDKALEDTIASLKRELEKARINERRLRFVVIDAKTFVDSVVKSEYTDEAARKMQSYLAKES